MHQLIHQWWKIIFMSVRDILRILHSKFRLSFGAQLGGLLYPDAS